MPFDWSFAWSILPVLLAASVITIQATIAAFMVAAVGGLALMLLRRAPGRLVRWPTAAVVEFIRSTPLLVQLYFLYFVLPNAGVVLSPFLTGVIGLGLHYSCYTSEAYRAGLESVPRGQWEAAVALNYRRRDMLARIVLPQAIPPVIPALGNYLIAMFKDTPMLAAISVVELMQTANLIASEKFLYVEPMTLVGLLFLVMSLIASYLVRRLEWRLAR
jgi:polar amino acid transport system permease protein